MTKTYENKFQCDDVSKYVHISQFFWNVLHEEFRKYNLVKVWKWHNQKHNIKHKVSTIIQQTLSTQWFITLSDNKKKHC